MEDYSLSFFFPHPPAPHPLLFYHLAEEKKEGKLSQTKSGKEVIMHNRRVNSRCARVRSRLGHFFLAFSGTLRASAILR